MEIHSIKKNPEQPYGMGVTRATRIILKGDQGAVREGYFQPHNSLRGPSSM